MVLASWLTITTLMAAGADLVVPPPEPHAPIDPTAGLPITDPSHAPLLMGLGHEPDVLAAFNQPTVLFVNFDGPWINGGCGNDSRGDCSTLYPDVQFSPSPSDDAKRAAVIQAVREDLQDFGVIVVGERPPDNNAYAMVVVGLPDTGVPGNIAGDAPGLDCGNDSPNLTSFSFLVHASANAQATVINQEAAHTWGLEHVNDDADNLFPAMGGVLDPKYQDHCSQVVADTRLTPTTAACNEVHTMFCPPDQQNSYQEMLLLFGPPIPDEVPPHVTIDSPTEGQVIEYTEDFDLTITLDDDRRPQVLDVHVLLDRVEETSAELHNSTFSFSVNGGDPPGGHGLSNGLHTVTVEITDEAGNPASAEVAIEIVGSPFGDPDGGFEIPDGEGTGHDDDPGSNDERPGASADPFENPDLDAGCGCRTRSFPPGSALLVLLMALGRRRRHRPARDPRHGEPR